MALRDTNHLLQHLEDGLGVLLVGADVVTHVIVVQTTIVLLLRVRLELTSFKAEFREVSTNSLKLLITVSSALYSGTYKEAIPRSWHHE